LLSCHATSMLEVHNPVVNKGSLEDPHHIQRQATEGCVAGGRRLSGFRFSMLADSALLSIRGTSSVE
jgi:hypothetical protein